MEISRRSEEGDENKGVEGRGGASKRNCGLYEIRAFLAFAHNVVYGR